jgi:predicted ArsR family transcriptional regulator
MLILDGWGWRCKSRMDDESGVDMPDADEQIAGIAVLNEPVRRELYRYVAAQGGDVTRDQAAKALGISRALAVFHLDRLAEEGLLEVSFRHLGQKRGPGSGRPSKLYRRSSRQLEVSMPPRSYELAAQLLATAVSTTPSPETGAALSRVARDFGESLGSEAERAAPSTDAESLLSAARGVLASYGFEPFRDAQGVIRLRNCPFHLLAEAHRGLVCGMNLSLMEGVVDGLRVSGIEAVLDPQPGMCCVAFRPIEH